MMNFGVRDLRLVNPCADYRSLDARRMALTAETIIHRASVFGSLEEALADCHLSFGTTRRFGKYRDDCITPEASAAMVLTRSPAERAAFVFGREDRGLHTAELDLCRHFVSIPTHAAFPSMNLSHAVAVVLYELDRGHPGRVTAFDGAHPPAASGDVERMFQHMRRTLTDVDYLDPQNPDHILRAFRRLFGRAGLTDREVRILQGLWSRIDWIDGERRKHSPKR